MRTMGESDDYQRGYRTGFQRAIRIQAKRFYDILFVRQVELRCALFINQYRHESRRRHNQEYLRGALDGFKEGRRIRRLGEFGLDYRELLRETRFEVEGPSNDLAPSNEREGIVS